MGKIKCIIDGETVECKVLENLGFQAGVYIKIVEYKEKERLIQKESGGIWQSRTVEERILPLKSINRNENRYL